MNFEDRCFKDIASELKMIRKVLERMAQASIFEKPITLTFNDILDSIPDADTPQEKQSL